MTVKQMYIELRNLGFPERLISKQTGITVSKFKNMRYGVGARFTEAEKAAFRAYYDHGKYMAHVYGEKLAEILKAKEEEYETNN